MGGRSRNKPYGRKILEQPPRDEDPEQTLWAEDTGTTSKGGRSRNKPYAYGQKILEQPPRAEDPETNPMGGRYYSTVEQPPRRKIRKQTLWAEDIRTISKGGRHRNKP